jgi:anaerobic selenocysteine-containing dehydrogenase
MAAEVRRTFCNRDCPDACAILATVEDGRVTRLRGDPEHPVTRGSLCWRTNHFLGLQYGPERLTTPMMRRDRCRPLEPVGWDEALDFAAERLITIRAESGPASIFHYRSGGSLGMLVGLSDLFFEHFGPVTTKRGDICSGAGEAAQVLDFGVSESNDLFDLLNSRHVLVWGKNVATSSPHTARVLHQARKGGAGLVLIDPVPHDTLKLCEAHVPVRPAGDYALAMAVARVVFDRGWADPDAASYCAGLDGFRALAESRSAEGWCADADVPIAAAEDLARRLHEGPTAILVGWGMGRRLNGGTIVRALDALGAITGNLGVAGGGVSFYFRRRGAFWNPRSGASARTICEPLFGPELLAAREPPVRAVWITAGNPVVMLPESETIAEALRTREFVAVVDPFLTDTARMADLVLPTTTLLEADDLLGAYGHHWLSASTPAVPPPDGVRSDLEIFQALALRVDPGGAIPKALAGSAAEWKARMVAPLAEHGVRVEDLEARGVRNPLAEPVLFHDRVFPTPSGKAELMTEAPAAEPAPDPAWPLYLMSLSTPESQSAQWSRPQVGLAPCTVHPDAAGGIADGETGRLVSAVGSMEVVVRHDPRQRTDVALVPKGGHRRLGRCPNGLVRARTTDLGEGGALYDEKVRLEPL